MWAYVSDYIRIKVLYEHGGIYFDTDVSVVKSLDPFLSEKAFVGMQNEEYVEPAILGSEPKNELLGDILNFYKNEIWTEEQSTMPQIFSIFFLKKYNLRGLP